MVWKGIAPYLLFTRSEDGSVAVLTAVQGVHLTAAGAEVNFPPVKFQIFKPGALVSAPLGFRILSTMNQVNWRLHEGFHISICRLEDYATYISLQSNAFQPMVGWFSTWIDWWSILGWALSTNSQPRSSFRRKLSKGYGMWKGMWRFFLMFLVVL